jgi:hypothetical protein
MTRDGRALGVIMLDTSFERPVGDVGNAGSWPFPVLFETVKGATARAVVDGREDALLDAFVAAGYALVDRGASALTTSCGFLVRRQSHLAARMPVPLATSSLLQIPLAQQALPAGRVVGVVTYDRASLNAAHFAEAGLSQEPPVVGLPKGGAFHGLIEGGQPYDRARLEQELMDVVAGLVAKTPDVGAILLECTNLPPFSSAIRKRFGVPVFDILTLGRWLHAGVAGG